MYCTAQYSTVCTVPELGQQPQQPQQQQKMSCLFIALKGIF